MSKPARKCPPNIPRDQLRLDVLLEGHAQEIASEWTARILEDPASPYRNLPRETSLPLQ